MNVVGPENLDVITPEQNRKSLGYLKLIKGIQSNQMWYIKITKYQFLWKVISGPHLLEIIITLISGIYL